MPTLSRRTLLPFAALLAATATVAINASAQATPPPTPWFLPGNLVVEVEGCGVHGGTCTSVPNGTGTTTGNATQGGYGDNQGAPLTLFQYTPSATSSVTYVNSLTLPQSALNGNLPVSSEYGSSSEGTLQLSGAGQYLTVMGYGLNANTFNAAYPPGFTADPYGAAPSGAMAQSGSLTGQSYTPVARVAALIDPYGNINSATAIYNIFNTNNPRSIYTADGYTYAYVSGQGSGCDATGGVFYIPLGKTTTAPTAITGLDAEGGNSSCLNLDFLAQDTRDVQIYDDTLYVSVDSKEGTGDSRSFIGTLGNPPATSLYEDAAGPTQLSQATTAGKSISNAGKITLTAPETNNINSTGLQVNLSPVSYFFASPTVMYVADSGNGKQTSANSSLGDGGLQKWVNVDGTWVFEYNLSAGLNLVANTSGTGTSGLYGLTGQVSGNNVYLYATNYTLSDLDPTYLYGITDSLSSTTKPTSSFTLLDTAPADSNFKGVSFAPTLPAGSTTITTVPSGLALTTAGAGCAAGTYTAPVTLPFAADSTCTLSTTYGQSGSGTLYTFSHWQDGSTAASREIPTPATSAVYTAVYTADSYELTTTAGAGGTITPTSYVTAGSTATVTATPTAGYQFINFTGSIASTSNPLTFAMTSPQTIHANFAKADTAISLQFTSVELTYPGTTNLTACVTGATTTIPTGSLTIRDGSTTVTTIGLQGNGCGNYELSNLTAGSHLISAAYSGDGNNPSGVSSTIGLAVNPVPVTLSPSCYNSSFTYGANYQCTVTVSSNAGPAQGNITYKYGSSAATTAPLINGNASITIPTPSVGSQTLTITYPRQTNYAASTTATETFTVTAAPVTIQLTPSTYNTTHGSDITLSATVTSSSATVPTTGTVSFYDGATLLFTDGVHNGGMASFTTRLLPTGTQTITATYSGNTNYSAGTSNSATVTITQ